MRLARNGLKKYFVDLLNEKKNVQGPIIILKFTPYLNVWLLESHNMSILVPMHYYDVHAYTHFIVPN